MPNTSPNFAPAPPPWTLNGEGILLLYRFKKSWVESKSNLPEHLQGQFKGGFGYVMLVDYSSSPVGPYQELLFIPGQFGENKFQSITRIFVNSEASTDQGRKNWGIPKETASFCWEKEKGKDRIEVELEGKTILDTEITHGGISFPISTALLPLRLKQMLDGKTWVTLPKGSGWGKLARVQRMRVDPQLFPDLEGIQPLLALKVNPFTIHFPIPSLLTNDE
ncbi:MAG: acetoacetate decarboxylase family protein [Bacteroidetes bacterium]|nr:acetoacetate decarboxylase family protein [Bacteroidota bacterium]